MSKREKPPARPPAIEPETGADDATPSSAASSVILSQKTMTGDIRDFILDRLKNDHSPIPWNLRGEQVQKDTIYAVEAAVRVFVARAVEVIAANGAKTLRGTLIKIVVKDGVQSQIDFFKGDELIGELIEAVGDKVLVSVLSADEFEGQRAPAKVTKDQGDLLGGDEVDLSPGDDSEPDGDPDPSDDLDPTED